LRAVLDVNVLISALLSPTGTPVRIMNAWRLGHFDLIVSGQLLSELERALAYPKLRRHVSPDEATEFMALLSRDAILENDPTEPHEVRSVDPGDDYLITLAAASNALLVSGDDHLLSLNAEIPVHSPAHFVELFAAQES
jgi:putative PIN family toxin of toxin-antitoxin system